MQFELLIEHTLFVLLLAVTVIALFRYQRSSPFPGPPSLPIIGSTPWLSEGAFTELVKSSWKEKYGPIFRVDFGMTRMFVICETNAAKEILSSSSIHIGGRPDLFFFQHELGLEENLITMCSSDNPLVDPCRKVNMRVVKELGFASTEHSSSEMVKYIRTRLKDSASATIDLFDFASSWATLTMLTASYGLYPTFEDLKTMPQVSKLLHSAHEVLLMASFNRELDSSIPFSSFFWRKNFIEKMETAKRIKRECSEGCEEMEKFTREQVEKKGGWDSWPDCTLKMIYNSETIATPAQASIQSAATLGAGFHTQNVTLRVVLGVVAFLQEHQQLLREEIRERDLPLGEGDEPVPLRALAIVRETLRRFSPVQSATPRSSTKELWFEGKKLPKGSIFLPIVETINSSHPFCVESYLEQLRLDQKASSVSAVNHHSFGFGRRSCPAGVWAERNLSFLLCKMVENFHLDFKEEKKKRIQSIDQALDYAENRINRIPYLAEVEFRRL